jgi:DNA-binding GntR family transcriptional regulator
MEVKEKKTITTSNKIAEALKHDINYGILKPGDSIIEREIAQKFQASHIPVREALRILEGEGFIIHHKYSGYSVREIKPEEMVELYDIMRFLTIQLLTRAIPRYTDLTFYQFNSIIDEMSQSEDVNNNILLLFQFAETAYAPAGLDYSFGLTKQILRRNIPIVQRVFEKIYKGHFPIRIQKNFVEFCQKKETAKAIDCYMDELNNLTKRLVASISESSK